MRIQKWDALERYLAELLLVEKLPVRKAVPLACLAFSDMPVSYLILSLVSSASVFDAGELSLTDKNRSRALDLYRAASMVAADVALSDVTGKPLTDCGSLLRWWQSAGEPFFDI